MKTLLLSKNDVAQCLDMESVIVAVEEAYKTFQRGMVTQPAIQGMSMEKFHAAMDVKTCNNNDTDQMSMKIVGLYPGNAKGEGKYKTSEGGILPNMMGNLILSDAQTGATIAIMDSSLITGIRTGAAGAVSAKYMSREDSKVAAVFASGAQARNQIYAVSLVRDLEEVRVYDKFGTPEGFAAYKEFIESKTNAKVVICDTVEEAAKGADILVCPTPSREAYLMADYVKPGMHIIEVGTDADFKNELEPAVFGKADKIVCDSIAQCIVRGDTQNAIKGGAITKDDIYGEIGEIVLGLKPGRESAEEITIFDTTGMAIQDNTTAASCYEVAVKKGIGSWFEFI